MRFGFSGLRRFPAGFTLVELLIALVILGEIATFSIPKILYASQNQSYNAAAKEVAAMLSGALQQAKLTGTLTANTKLHDLTPYMNFVAIDSTSDIDFLYNTSTINFPCNYNSDYCLVLHNGGKLLLNGQSFGGTASTNAVYFYFDPDGKVTDGTTNSPGRSLRLYLFYNGRVQTEGTVQPGTCGLPYGCLPASYPRPTNDPPWFSW
jgi:prepilin-type N-terminal cleavage/methylation domain-containing protein